MTEKILVAYASRTGAAKEIAEAIGKSLADGGADVEIRSMTEIKDLSPYSAVVAGGTIRGSKWLPEAMDYSPAPGQLEESPFAAFMVCITLAMKNGENYGQGIRDWMSPVRGMVRPVSEGYFAGRLDFSKMPFSFDSLKMRFSVAIGVFPRDDRRDWAAIQQWAESLPPLLR